MSDTEQILEAWQRIAKDGEEAVLATVVKTEGSAYRRPGARMLITPEGGHKGTISGGCLEGDVIRKAWWLTESRKAIVLSYDTRAGEDEQWSFGLGCNGVVYVMLERLGTQRPSDILNILSLVRKKNQAAASAVVVATEGGCEATVGDRISLLPDGSTRSDVKSASWKDAVLNDLRGVRQDRKSRICCYPVPGGMIELFLEYLPPPQRLIVFGAGFDALPVVRLGKNLGWHVTVADSRAHFVRKQRFPMADNLVLTSLARPLEGTGIDKDASVIVMTHSFEQDKAILANMTGIALRYIGQLGPRERTERLLSELEAESGVPWQSLTGRLHYPIGLDIGADTPEEIALAIVAEIKAELSERSGRRLGERYGAINDSNLRTEQPSILRAKDPRGVSDSLTRGEANCAITHFIQ